MSKIFKTILFLFLVSFLLSCSLDNKTGIWTNYEKIVAEEVKLIQLTKDAEIIKKEFNSNLQIRLKQKNNSNRKINWFFSDGNLTNLVSHMSLNAKVKKYKKYKFKKIIKRKVLEPDIIISNDFVIFYDNNGSILKFNNDKKAKLQWKKKVYSKKERNKIFSLSLALSNNTLYVADNLGKYYSINIKTGEINWKRVNQGRFNSQIKIVKNKILLIDTNNSLWCFSTKDGSVLWNFKTQESLIKSYKKLSLVVHKNKIFFLNSIGDFSKLDLETGELVWQMPTQNVIVQNDIDFLKNSDLVLHKNSLIFSNNNNQFYSININSGVINWIQSVNSYIRPIIIDNLIFTISNKGYLIVIDFKKGGIIRATSLLSGLKKKYKNKISFEGFLIASNKLYVTTNKGILIKYSILDGKLDKIYKISKTKLSEPFINNNNLYIFRDNSVVVLN